VDLGGNSRFKYEGHIIVISGNMSAGQQKLEMKQ
jgi:hypothetical protein